MIWALATRSAGSKIASYRDPRNHVGDSEQVCASVTALPYQRLTTISTCWPPIPACGSALVKEVMVISGKKRKAVPGWDVCANFKEEYDVGVAISIAHNGKRFLMEENISKGDLDVDEDYFPDHDEDCHGPMDTEENRAGIYLGLL
ncbi:uncharacterized protein HD556DRAFT_1303289 [Suillus plorans]|uniref:Uncharacterized protein n=1 Tax=Suillus plorans TaxID=116603 RepID=A0A9P7J664_9AGAM|nr:uncharacterized protein HD556DRAFT_1303289 [Suillus plorans]KAG1804688.1 hypothetical protein HD556DRAFT_1303289 [Suillus plorans]